MKISNFGVIFIVLWSVNLYAKEFTYQKNETFFLQKGETISDLLARAGYGNLLMYGDESVVNKVLEINKMSDDDAKKLEIGTKIYIPKNIFLNDGKLGLKKEKIPVNTNTRGVDKTLNDYNMFDTNTSPYFSFSTEKADESFAFNALAYTHYSKLDGEQTIGSGAGTKAVDLLSDLNFGLVLNIDYFRKKDARFKYMARLGFENYTYSENLAPEITSDNELFGIDIALGAGYYFDSNWDISLYLGHKDQVNYFADANSGEIEFFTDKVNYFELSSQYAFFRYKMALLNELDHISTIALKLGGGVSSEGEYVNSGNFYYGGIMWNIIKGWTVDIQYKKATFSRSFLDINYTTTHFGFSRNIHF